MKKYNYNEYSRTHSGFTTIMMLPTLLVLYVATMWLENYFYPGYIVDTDRYIFLTILAIVAFIFPIIIRIISYKRWKKKNTGRD